jgi:hypothetical protein
MRDVTVRAFGASFDGLALPVGITIDHVMIEGADATIKHDPFQINLLTPGRFEAHVGERNLAAFLNKEAPGGLKDFLVTIQDGKLYVTAIAKMLFEIKAEAVCTLRVVDGKLLYVDLESVEMMGVGAKALVEQQLDKVNPVLNAAEFPLKVTIERVDARDGEVILFGTAEP